MQFTDKVLASTVEKLLAGKDYRAEIINAINSIFFDYSLQFFKEIVNAKFDKKPLTLDWYKEHFLDNEAYPPEEIAILAGINKKTITNIYGRATKNVVIDVAKANYAYLSSILAELQDNSELLLKIQLSYNDIVISLDFVESLIVINALATKKIQLRGGAWSSIGKSVEKPLLNRLCDLAGVPAANRDSSSFQKDKAKKYDREVDYKLISRKGKIYNIEVKLMGKGNPESADGAIARVSDIFVADTLSTQNKEQLQALGILYLTMRDNPDIVGDFTAILEKLDIPFQV